MLNFKQVDKDRGRIEIHAATICHDIREIQDRHRQSGLQAVGEVASAREIKGKSTTKSHYFLPSSKLEPERFLVMSRAHWSVENSLPRAFDVTINEDAQGNREGCGAENLALMRHLALNIARAASGRKSVHEKM